MERFKKSININLKATVDRYTNIDKPKGESESVSKNIFLSRCQENEIFPTNFQQHPHQIEIYQYIET